MQINSKIQDLLPDVVTVTFQHTTGHLVASDRYEFGQLALTLLVTLVHSCSVEEFIESGHASC